MRRYRLLNLVAAHVVGLAVAASMASVTLCAASLPPQRCAAAKVRAAGTAVYAKAKCYQRALLAGLSVSTICLTTAEQKFTAAFVNAEAAGGCQVTDDAGSIGAAVDACLESFTGAITGDANCAAAKTKAVGRKTYQKAKCQRRAFLAGVDPDPLCLIKAEAKFAAAVAKADLVGTCSDTAVALEALVDACVSDLVPTAPCTDYRFVTAWGSAGSGYGEFLAPRALAMDGSGNVYVTDDNHRVQKFSNTGVFLTAWGSGGSAHGQFSYPSGIAVDGSGSVYVVDTGNTRIQKFTDTGTFIAAWGGGGTGDGQFSHPYGIAVDGGGNVFVTDFDWQCQEFGPCVTVIARIEKFTNTGTFLTAWGTPGNANGQFDFLYGLAADSSGSVYVSDWGNARIQTFTNDGTFVSALGGYFVMPFALTLDGSGNIFVADTDNNLQDARARIEKFTNNGTFLTEWGTPGSANGQFGNGGPAGVAVDAAGNVFVADIMNNRIQKFACP